MLTTKLRRFFSIQQRLNKFQPPASVKQNQKKVGTNLAAAIPNYSNPPSEKHYPIQHPSKIDSPNSSILTREKPVDFIQPRFETPFEIYHPSDYKLDVVDQPVSPRLIEVALIGAPNAGKSSLMNAILSSQISAVSNKSNTTYESILGVHTNIEKQTQILIHDTPGITKQSRLSKNYVTRAWDILNDVEKAIFVVDGVKTLDDKIREALRRLNKLPYDDHSERRIAKIASLDKNDPLYNEKLKQALEMEPVVSPANAESNQLEQTFPKILVVNKMDLCTNRKKLNWLVQELEDLSKFEQKFFVSSTTGFGIPALIEYLESEAFPCPWRVHSQVKSGLSKIEIIEQIMKSAIFSRYFEEMPYQIGVSLTEYATRSDGVVKLHFVLDVDSIPQKKIVTGHQGRNVRELISLCRMEMAKAFQREMEISVQIKLRKESLEHSNSHVEEVTSDTYAEFQGQSILKESELRRKRLAAELESILPYPYKTS